MNDKSYCFINIRDLKMKDSNTKEVYNPVLAAAINNVPIKYQYLILVFNSKFNGPSFWYPERNEIYEFMSKHIFDASKSKIIKDNKVTYVNNIKSVIFNNDIIINTILDFKTIDDVGLFLNNLILNNCYDNYYKMIQEIFNNYLIISDEDEELYDDIKRKREKKLIS